MSPSTSNPKKSVSFASYSEQYYVLHINDYTQDEIDATWYTHEELKQVKARVRNTLKKVRHGIPLLPKDDCFMGLESYTPHGLEMKHQQRFNSISVVLDEQETQKSSEMKTEDSDEIIADLYYEITYTSQMVAHGRGIQHHQESVMGWIGSQLLALYESKQHEQQDKKLEQQQEKQGSSCAAPTQQQVVIEYSKTCNCMTTTTTTTYRQVHSTAA